MPDEVNGHDDEDEDADNDDEEEADDDEEEGDDDEEEWDDEEEEEDDDEEEWEDDDEGGQYEHEEGGDINDRHAIGFDIISVMIISYCFFHDDPSFFSPPVCRIHHASTTGLS